MASNIFSIPGIARIDYILKEEIPAHVIERAQAGMPIGIFSIPCPLVFHGDPTCTCEGSNENNGRTEKTTLEFKSLQVVPEDAEVGFLVTGQDGQAYLIGALEETQPAIQATQNFGVPSSEPRYISYHVEYTAPKALIPCVLPC